MIRTDEKDVSYPCERCTSKSKRFKEENPNDCVMAKKCEAWIEWVGYEWRKIQKTYEGVKKHE